MPTSCCEKLSRWLTHCWFCGVCCAFVLLTTLPRLTAFLDGVLTFLLYSFWLREQRFGEQDVKLGEYISHDIEDFKFSHSGLPVLVLSWARSVILFFVFAWKHNMDHRTLFLSSLIMAISLVYLSITLAFASDDLRTLVLFSICMTLFQWMSYMCVRRRDIRAVSVRKRYRAPRVAAIFPLGGGTTGAKYHSLGESDSGSPSKIGSNIFDPGLYSDTPSTPGRAYRPERPFSGGSTSDRRSSLSSTSGAEGTQAAAVAVNSGSDNSRSGSMMMGEEEKGGAMHRSESVNSFGVPASGNRGEELDEYPHREVDPKLLAVPESRFMKLDNVDVHYVFWRKGAAPTSPKAKAEQKVVVLLHGFGGNVFSWRLIWEGLKENVDVLLAFDRPGFGLSSRLLKDSSGSFGKIAGSDIPQDNPYTNSYSERLLFMLCQRLDLSHIVLVGHSTGAQIALQAALHQPTVVRKLVLIGPHIFTDGFPDLVKTFFSTSLGKQIAAQLIRSELSDVALRRQWFEERAIPEDEFTIHRRTLQVTHWFEALLEIASLGKQKADKLSLNEIFAPVLIIHGKQDKVVALADSKRATQLLHNVQLQAIDRVGHVPHLETPGTLIQCIAEFICPPSMWDGKASNAPSTNQPVRAGLATVPLEQGPRDRQGQVDMDHIIPPGSEGGVQHSSLDSTSSSSSSSSSFFSSSSSSSPSTLFPFSSSTSSSSSSSSSSSYPPSPLSALSPHPVITPRTEARQPLIQPTSDPATEISFSYDP